MTVIKVADMHCEKCVSRITNLLTVLTWNRIVYRQNNLVLSTFQRKFAQFFRLPSANRPNHAHSEYLS